MHLQISLKRIMLLFGGGGGGASQLALVVKNPPASAGDLYSCLESPMDRGTWRLTVHGVAEPDTTEVSQHPCFFLVIYYFFKKIFCLKKKNSPNPRTKMNDRWYFGVFPVSLFSA